MFDLFRKFRRPDHFGRRPDYSFKVRTVEAVSYVAAAGTTQWYPPVMAGADTIRPWYTEPPIAAFKLADDER